MNRRISPNELTKRYMMNLRPSDMDKLKDLSVAYNGNLSATARAVIEKAWAEKTQKDYERTGA